MIVRGANVKSRQRKCSVCGELFWFTQIQGPVFDEDYICSEKCIDERNKALVNASDVPLIAGKRGGFGPQSRAIEKPRLTTSVLSGVPRKIRPAS